MKGPPSERLIQVLLGILILTASGLYLWRNTVRPILKVSPSLDSVAETVRLGDRYTSWKDRMEDVRAKALEADRERLHSRDKAGSAGDEAGNPPNGAERTGSQQ
jgi:hypothetical protein